MSELTDQNSVVAQALVDLLTDHWKDLVPTKRDIYYGDESMYPRYPAISVESGPQDRPLNQTGLQQRIGFSMFILLYHGPIKTLGARKKELDELTSRCVGFLHTDRSLGGRVIHGHVTGVEPGFTTRGGALVITDRITWEGISNFTMPKAAAS